jgi:hypothetical protein
VLPAADTAFAWHGWHADAAAPENVLVGQTVHAAEELAPVVLEYVPDRHDTHTFALVAPDTPEYVPVGHETHALTLLAPVTFEYVPVEQAVQLGALTTVEYVPTGQGVHTPLDPYVPTAQAGKTQTLAPAVDVLPDSHVVQKFAPALEYLPTGQ